MTERGTAACLLAITVASGCRGAQPSSGSTAQTRLSMPTPGAAARANALAATVEPVALSGAAADIRFWATMRNPHGSECSPVFIDTAMSDSKPNSLLSPRPTTVISMAVQDERGRLVEAKWPGGIKHAALRAQQLVLLACGEGYSWEVRPARVPWGYELTPGRYVARISLQVPIASFVKWHLSLENEVVTLWPSTDQTALRYLRDVATDPVEVTFVVTQ